MKTKYKLVNRQAVPCSLEEWAEQFKNPDRVVAQTNVGGQRVSTVFLGLDHSFGNGPPLLFETMIFGGPSDQQYQERCSTWEQAEAQHAAAVALAQGMEAGTGETLLSGSTPKARQPGPKDAP